MLIIKHCRLFDGLNETVKDNQSVVIEDGRIRYIVDGEETSKHADVINAAGATLTPGLIDAHVHVLAASASLKQVDFMAPSYVAQFAHHSLRAMLRRGFTSVRDAAGADYGLAQAVEEGLIDGPRLFYCGKALSQTGGHGDWTPFEGGCLCGCGASTSISRIADGVENVQHAARDELRRGANHIKIMAGGGVASPSDPIDVLQYTEDEIRAIVWEAKAWGKYCLAHAYIPEAVSRCLEFGVRSIEHANLIDRSACELAKQREAFIVPTVSTYEALAKHGKAMGFPSVSCAKVEDVRQQGLDALDLLRDTGVQVGFGSDLLGDMQRYQMREFMLRGETFSPIEVLKQATSVNARLLEREGDIGVIRPGALADLALWEGNPDENLGVLEYPEKTLKAVFKEGCQVSL
ncbi:imidazolonepropionase-like amidohydrolase [Chromohalobacter marismortui]|uniref:Imidazolonepropionase-like amidohydrolase n=1 Tax=Chromohalobacter marismortui TaxID=42055 RepID=A0A4R7NNV2_9GAMM|nr:MULTISPECIES: amidohydrolase family protein [Chromohalobacter]MCI0509978.1 amidohydrolase family protein [Chromohalobacter sp.]MCI0593090.1 amidohydrolase family protein [Chromohalobacter sp.]TDU22121.1 imidazolonepropionase-like amidohydrolase [Chromohalobacter marismortui]